MLLPAIEASEHELLPWGVSFARVLLVLVAVTVVEVGTILLADPWQQLAAVRNAERTNHVNTIANAYYVRYAENRGRFLCDSGPVPLNPTPIQSEDGYHLAPCMVPEHLPEIPHDPGDPEAYYRSPEEYRSGYRWMQNAASGRIVVLAPAAELGATIQVER